MRWSEDEVDVPVMSDGGHEGRREFGREKIWDGGKFGTERGKFGRTARERNLGGTRTFVYPLHRPAYRNPLRLKSLTPQSHSPKLLSSHLSPITSDPHISIFQLYGQPLRRPYAAIHSTNFSPLTCMRLVTHESIDTTEIVRPASRPSAKLHFPLPLNRQLKSFPALRHRQGEILHDHV